MGIVIRFVYLTYLWVCWLVASTSVTLRLPRSVVERVEKEARRAGLGLEEYVLELVLQSMDPEERALEYVEAAKSLLEQAREELKKSDVRQAAEKIWGAAALAVKAYAEWKESKRLASHGELWEYMRKMVRELGGWIREAWMYANGMHTCFYEGWCTKEDAEDAIKRTEKLVTEVKARLQSQRKRIE